MTKTLWTLPLIALAMTACKKDDKDDTGTDTTPVEDTFDTSAPAKTIESFSFLVRFGYRASDQMAVPVDIDGDDIFPGIYYTVGENRYFTGGSGDNCRINIVWEDELAMADWAGEVDGDVAFEVAAADAMVYTNCSTVYGDAEVTAFVENVIGDSQMGWAIGNPFPREVRDWFTQVGEERSDYIGGGLYQAADEEFDDEGFTDFGYAFPFETEGTTDLSAVIDEDDMFVPIDPDDFYTVVNVTPEDTDTEDTDTPATQTITTPTTALWNIGWIYYYTFN